MPFSFTIEGLPQAIAATKLLAETLPETIVNTAMPVIQKGFEMMEKDCPVDTGKMKSTIKLTKGNGKPVIASITVGVNYAVPVNFGHKTKNGKWVKPQPFATNAYNYILDQLPAVFRR